jgi:hypothetical protein
LQAIELLPDIIDVADSETWGIRYEKRFVGSALIDQPAGIYLKLDEQLPSPGIHGISISLPAELFSDEDLDEIEDLWNRNNIDPSVNPFEQVVMNGQIGKLRTIKETLGIRVPLFKSEVL